MATDPVMAAVLNLPFKEQIDYFSRKLNLPTERWDDLLNSAHDRAFVVAGAMKADLLADLHASILKHIDGGLGLEGYRKDFKAIVARHGWTGWTGEGTPGGVAWRTRTTYMTNLRTSLAAGRYQQLTDSPNLRYWMWRHSGLAREPRAQHLAWDGMVLPADHPFWKQHYPPQIPPHWGCGCGVVGMETLDDAQALGGDLSKTLPDDWQQVDAEYKDPALLAQGWNFAPGANVDTALRELVEKKLISYPPAIAKALSRDLNRYLSAEHPPALFAEAVLADRQLTHDQWLGFPDNFERIQRDTGQDVKGYIGILPAQTPRHVMNSHQYDGKGQRPATPEDYNSVWTVLNEADDIKPGSNDGHNHLDTIVAVKMMGGEKWRAVYEIRPGRKTRLLALMSLVIKTAH